MHANPQQDEFLILTKTYPAPSTKHRETTCVAAFNCAGALRRLFPVPFRFLEGDQQFKKWEWVRACANHASNDQRPESYRLDLDSVTCIGQRIGTEHGWAERRRWIEPHVVSSFSRLEERRKHTGETLGFLRPSRLVHLEIVPAKEPDWTDDDQRKLQQDGLFDTPAAKARPPLRKLPYDFYYHYECVTRTGTELLKHKITDWEAGALFWNCVQRDGAEWEQPLR